MGFGSRFRCAGDNGQCHRQADDGVAQACPYAVRLEGEGKRAVTEFHDDLPLSAQCPLSFKM